MRPRDQFPSFRLDGRVALVTGGSQGIGEAIALALADAGADVALTSRTLTRARPVAARIEAMGRRALPLAMEVSDLHSVQRAVDAALQHFGQVDILVNNAGLNIPAPALEVTEAQWDTILDTNLKGLFFATQRVGKQMLERGWGRVVQISSQMGVIGGPRRSVYCASKGAVNQLSKALALEWATCGVTVNAVAPTYIRTPLTEPMFQDEAFLKDTLQRIPMGRVGEVHEVTGAVVFLASESAGFITGHTLLVDGGYVAQ